MTVHTPFTKGLNHGQNHSANVPFCAFCFCYVQLTVMVILRTLSWSVILFAASGFPHNCYPDPRGSTTGSPSLSCESCDIWYPARYVIMMAVGFHKDLYGSFSQQRNSAFGGLNIAQTSVLLSLFVFFNHSRNLRMIREFSPPVSKLLQRKDNTHSDKGRKFELYWRRESRVSRPTKSPIQILMKSNGHHYDVTHWVSNVTWLAWYAWATCTCASTR